MDEIIIVVVVVWLFSSLWLWLKTVVFQASLSFIISCSLLKLIYIELLMPSNHLILCHPFLLLPWIFPSIRVFPNESALHIRWPKWWSFSCIISPLNEYSVLVSFRIDWFDLLAVKGTLESHLQHHRSKTSIIQHSAFTVVLLSHPYVTTGETVGLAIQTFVGKWWLCFLFILFYFILLVGG